MAKTPLVQKLLPTKTRIDNRLQTSVRQLQLSFPSDFGVVEAKRGNTIITAKCTLELVKPEQRTPHKGFMTIRIQNTLGTQNSGKITTEQSLYCAEPGIQPSAEENELRLIKSSLTQILIRSGVVSLETLCLEAGKWVYKLIVNISIDSNDGGIIDVALAAASAAILHVGIPPIEIVNDQVRQLSRHERNYNSISMKYVPCSITFSHVKKNVKIDYAEELAALENGITIDDIDEDDLENSDKENENENNKSKENKFNTANIKQKIEINKYNSPYVHLPDPCREELYASEGITVVALDKSGVIVGLFKGDGTPLGIKEIEEICVESTYMTAGISNLIEKLVIEDLEERKLTEIKKLGYTAKE